MSCRECITEQSLVKKNLIKRESARNHSNNAMTPPPFTNQVIHLNPKEHKDTHRLCKILRLRNSQSYCRKVDKHLCQSFPIALALICQDQNERDGALRSLPWQFPLPHGHFSSARTPALLARP